MSRTPRSIILHPHLSMLDRFWKKVNKNGPIPKNRPDIGPCWIWISAHKYPIGKHRCHECHRLVMRRYRENKIN